MTTLMTHSPVPPGSKSVSNFRTYTTSPTFSDPHSQLDDIISDLLSDRAFTTDQEDSDSIDQGPQHGSITRHDGNNRTVVSWQKKASGPSRSITVSSHTVSRPTPNSRIESDCTQQKSMSVQRFPGGSIGSASRYDEDQWAASDRYLYRTTQETKSFEESKSEINKLNTMFAPSLQGAAPPAPRRLISYDGVDGRQGPPYRKELAEVLTKRSMSQNNKLYSDSEDATGTSWLDSQREKLNQKREVRGLSTSRAYTAQSDTEDNRVFGRRSKDFASSRYPVNSYDSLDELSNLLNESSRDLTNTWQEHQKKQQKVQKYHQIQQRSSSVDAMRDNSQKPCFFVSGLEKPAFSKQTTKYVFAVSPSPSTLLRDDSLEEKFSRASCLSPPPPKRGDSSKEAVQRRHAPSVDELDQTLAKILAANNQPKPETDLIIEEEVISLEPIGRGIQTLEPDTETLSRNRSRAPTPVYPGFPTSGYRSPSLSRMQEGFTSPTPSGFRSPTPGRMFPSPVVNGPSTPFAQDRSNSSTMIRTAHSSSTISKSTDQEKQPISSVNNGNKSLSQERAPSRLASKEEDLEEAVSFMMANAEPFKKTTNSMNTSASQKSTVRNEVAAIDSTMNDEISWEQAAPSKSMTVTTVNKSQTTPASSSVNDLSPASPAAQKNLTYMEQQKNVLKQQQQLLLQSQQLQQLEQQERELKEKQLQIQKELQQHQQLQHQNRSGTGKWVVKEETVTRTLKNSGGNDVVDNAIMTSSAQKQQQQGNNVNLEQQMFEIERQMQQESSNQGTLKQHDASNGNIQQQQHQNGLLTAAYKQHNQSNAVQQLDDLSKQIKQMQQQDAVQQADVVSQQQRQQAVTTKFGSQQQNISAAPAICSKAAHGLHREEQSVEYSSALPKESCQTALRVEETSSESKTTGSMLRSPSPSMWTNETLRSYTARTHAGSASPLLPPGSTLRQGRASPHFGQSRSGSISSVNDMDTLNQIPRFVKDSSRLWHRPNITREEAVSVLKDKPAGSFIVRNSSTFQGAYGLALKVSQLPPNVQVKGGDPLTELVRHFLIEPTAGGVRLKGCSNEPVFSSLAALVYQHTITPLALPCKLLLPEDTEVKFVDVTDVSAGVLAQGAACNVLYLSSIDTESLTGPAAISTTIQKTFANNGQPRTTLVQFKVSAQGITLTDHQRSIFFRRHYPMNTVSYCGIDEGNERRWNPNNEDSNISVGGKVFGFVARKPGSITENTCHIFVESDPSQPASAIVDFMTKIMVSQGHSVKS